MINERNKWLRSLLDAFPDGVLSLSMDGSIIQANRGFNELLGYNSFIIGKSIFSLAPSYAKKNIEALFRELETKERLMHRRLQLYDVKGRLCNLEASLSLLSNNEGKPVGAVAIISDAEGEARLEKELLELRDFSSNVLDASGVGIIVTDLKGTIVFSSRESAKIFGVSLDGLKGRNILKSSPNTLLLSERFASLIKTGMSFEFEWSIKGDGGSRDFISVFTLLRGREGNPAGAVVVFEDVTKVKGIETGLKETNAVLREYTRNLESIVETTRTLSSSLDRGKIYGAMAKAIMTMFDANYMCFLRHDKRKLVLDSLEGVRAGQLETLDMRLRKYYPLLLKLKAPKIVADLSSEKSFSKLATMIDKGLKSAVFVPVYSKDAIFGVIGVFWSGKREFKRTDVEMLQSVGNSGVIAIENAMLYNEVKGFAADLEEKVRERTVELERSNKLKDLFIDIMRHDLLSPANIAQLSTELLIEQENEPEKTKMLEIVLQSHRRIIDMIRNASILAKLESGEKLEFGESDLGSVLRDAAEELKGFAIEKRLEIKITSEGRVPATTNPLIHNVFSNLLRNAVKYAPQDSQVNVKITDRGPRWRVSIADRGSGIPDEHKEAIFERFKRLEKGAVEGTGLGLAIVKKVVNAHKGRVWVEDNAGGGSIFIVEIPKS